MPQRTRHTNAADDLAYLLRHASPDVAADNAAALADLRNANALGGAAPYRLTETKPHTPAPQPAAQSVILPLPPSVNHYTVNTGRGGRALTDEARNWKQAADIAVYHAHLVRYDGPVAVTLHVYRAQRSGDLDNRAKLTLDALNGHAWRDDAQVVELHAYRHDDAANPRVEVEIRRVEGEDARP